MAARRLTVGIVAVLLCITGVTIALLSRDDGDLSPDCQHIDAALRAWEV